MSDNNVVVDEKPKDERIIGRVNNELHPSTDQARAATQPVIGRIYNELHPGTDQAGLPTQHVIGRIYNELIEK